jgi:hypothetical protein
LHSFQKQTQWAYLPFFLAMISKGRAIEELFNYHFFCLNVKHTTSCLCPRIFVHTLPLQICFLVTSLKLVSNCQKLCAPRAIMGSIHDVIAAIINFFLIRRHEFEYFSENRIKKHWYDVKMIFRINCYLIFFMIITLYFEKSFSYIRILFNNLKFKIVFIF